MRDLKLWHLTRYYREYNDRVGKRNSNSMRLLDAVCLQADVAFHATNPTKDTHRYATPTTKTKYRTS